MKDILVREVREKEKREERRMERRRWPKEKKKKERERVTSMVLKDGVGQKSGSIIWGPFSFKRQGKP